MRWPGNRPETVTEVVHDTQIQRLRALADKDLHLQKVDGYEPCADFRVCMLCGCMVAVEFLPPAPGRLRGMKIIVFHMGYGCDTGCCGHAIEVDGTIRPGSFEFGHPYDDDPKTYAEDLVRREMGEEHVADLDWEHCLVQDGENC